MKERKIKLNKSLKTPFGHKMQGAIIKITCDSNGTPTDLFWRARLKDSEIDNCIEFVEEKRIKPIQEEPKQEEIKEEVKINKKRRNR
jgi:hypothetical protein